MNIKCAIVDDEELARQLINDFSARIPAIDIAGQFKSPLEALHLIHEKKIDLLFLDIQMPDVKGTDFLKSIRDTKPMIIFTTAYPDYAIEGYELDVVDYLLKPFTFDRFLQAVNKALRHQELLKKEDEDDFIKVNADHKIYRLNKSDILYIEGLKEYVSYYTVQGKRIVAFQSMKALEVSLPGREFIRIHRSYIIRKECISYVEGNSVMIGEKRIPIGRSYREHVFDKLI